ncbi:MAG TPA: glycosyltransferase [Galbitalea sp.]|jgi:D-inositol-3-phosphate glycosyltransferase
MSGGLRRIAMVAMHTSPVAPPGTGDAGGMNVTVLALASQLARRGVEVDILTRATAAPEERELADGLVLRSLAAGPPEPLAKSRLVEVADEFGEAVATLAGRSEPRYDLLHSHYWLSGLSTLPVAIELGLPFVQSFHTLGAMKNAALPPGDLPEPEGRLRGEAFLANQADAIVAGSAAEVGTLIDELRTPPERLWVIPPGVDTELFSPDRARNDAAVRARLGLPANRPLLVLAGRVQPLKDQELGIRILAELAMVSPAPLLVIAGEATDPAYRERLTQAAIMRRVEDDVRFVGALERETLADLFAAAECTLVTSYSESFGLVALESAASGTPVVAYRSSGLVESVRDGESGYLLERRDPADWAAAILAHRADGARVAAMRRSARSFAEGFTWATAAASHLALYESLVR